MKMTTVSGTAMAAAAAGLFLSGAVVAPTAALAKPVHCMGVNACKGQGACKTAKNTCKGQNSCKGQGFSLLSKGKCEKAGGTVG